MDDVQCTLPKNKNEFSQQLGIQMKEQGEGDLKREVEKYKRLLKDVSDPNCGRIKELKEAIRKGTFLTKEAISETAERIAARFLGRE
ncbi:MAG: hypothetical protein HY582_02885 [Candidatus Omnitrophica bacterium]|nr:hypothetical protein [Candidatus Omnitrophota bacterium]